MERQNNKCSNCNQTPGKSEEEFISPYSYRQGYKLVWKKVNPNDVGDPDLSWLNEKSKTLLTVLSQVKYMTRGQIKNTIWPKGNNKHDITKRLNKLVNAGALVQHKLINKHKKMIVYTLGQKGCEVLNIRYDPNWWLEVHLTTLLKQLIANQFFLRIYCNSRVSKYFSAPYPFTGVVIFNDMEFPLLVVRGDVDNLIGEFKYIEFEKAIIICEDKEQINRVIGSLDKKIVRFTTDYEMCNLPLKFAFYQWDNGALSQEIIPFFPDHV